MSTGPRIQNWQVLRAVNKVGRLNKYIEIPTFSQASFRPNASLNLTGLQASAIGIAEDYSGHTGFTFECWVKNISPLPSIEQILYMNRRTVENDVQWKVSVIDGKIVFTWLDTSLTEISVTSINFLPHGVWCHVAVSWGETEVIIYVDGQLSTRFYGDGIDFYVDGAFVTKLEEGVALYIDGVEVLTSETLAMAEAANHHYIGAIGSTEVVDKIFIGYIAELRYWSTVQSSENIAYKSNKPRNATAGDGVDDELTWYLSMSRFNSAVVYQDITDAVRITLSTGAEISEEEFPPLIYGASFIPVLFSVVSSAAHSLKYPIEKPTDCNFGLYVAWTDENGEFQRRQLFTVDGVDIKPDVGSYKGERLPIEYYIEVWNIDGIDNVTLTEVIPILTSITAPMSAITDTTGTALTTLTADTLLAEPFPLTNFPLTFNTQQTY